MPLAATPLALRGGLWTGKSLSFVRTHLDAPTCPNCRERLSDVEAGLVGVWSCLYCEGAWFSTTEVRRLSLQAHQTATSALAERVENLECPKCKGREFQTLVKRDLALHECCTCASTFMPRRTVVALGSALGGGRWNIGEALAALVGRSETTTVDAVILVGMIAALLFA